LILPFCQLAAYIQRIIVANKMPGGHMVCATRGDLKKLLSGGKDSDVLVFEIFSEDEPGKVRFSSDIADVSTLTAREKFAQQTSDGDRDILKSTLVMDLNACGE
jgi:hypothetical protein